MLTVAPCSKSHVTILGCAMNCALRDMILTTDEVQQLCIDVFSFWSVRDVLSGDVDSVSVHSLVSSAVSS